MLTKEKIYQIFDSIIEPKLKWNINTLNLLKSVEIDPETQAVDIKVNLITKVPAEIELFKKNALEILQKSGCKQVNLIIGHANVAEQGISNIQHVLLVGSGKGGVGKSTIATQLARSLQQQGYKTGLMDADIYGPSLPRLLDVYEKPEVTPNDCLTPIIKSGIKTMSVGYLIDQSQALDWRGQMTSGTVLQFIEKTLWGPLDFLIVDLPPGTGDVTLTILHKLKCDGAIIVTTPSPVALDDVQRSLNLFNERQVPILGFVENMHHSICQQCGASQTIFEAPTNKIENILQIPRLATLPVQPHFEADDPNFVQLIQKIMERLPNCNPETLLQSKTA